MSSTVDTTILDPTYTGLNRISLSELPNDEHQAESETITFERLRVPQLRLGGRAGRYTTQVMFRDPHNIGYSRFDDKGSVLMANIDAVLNLTGHLGGYLAQGTRFDNSSFYSLLLEDHTLEMHSYVQWRRPLSVSRVVMSRALTKPHLKTVQLDTMLKNDVPAIIALKPCNGYQIVGYIAHGGGDLLTGAKSVTLKDLVVTALISLTVLAPKTGKAFVVFPFGPSQNISGTLTVESILDFCLLLTILYHHVWFFRPYMCNDLICAGFSEPREDPPKNSPDEQRLLALWDAMNLLPPLVKSTVVVDPVISKLAELDPPAPIEIPVPTSVDPESTEYDGMMKLEGAKNFARLFEGTNITIEFPVLAARVNEVLSTAVDIRRTRDRVEVLSRWQLPDTIESTRYPF